MKKFFFDTANIDFIKNTLAQLAPHVNKDLVVGITTNPNTFYKIDKHRLHEWFNHTTKLCQLVTEIRQDNKGVVYIQVPSSKMTQLEIINYAKKVSKLSDGNTKIGLKIPPYQHILEIVEELNSIVEVNVTGLADSSTALKCLTYPVKYISIIPGRMEEVGIDAKSQISFINQSNMKSAEIIAGSMRTIEGLMWTFQYGTVPTIGEKVWNLILENDNLDKLISLDYTIDTTTSQFSPSIDNRNYDLSVAFFNQMDDCGKQAYNELINLNQK